jgi:UDP-sulfoquinovose synthase
MKVLILGIDGYIGWSLALHLLNKGYEVVGLDDNSRRYKVKKLGGDSLTPIPAWVTRSRILKDTFRNYYGSYHLTLGRDEYAKVLDAILFNKPDAIVHLAEQPSAPYSMHSAELASLTQHYNVIGTLQLLWAMREACPNAHLIKLGTMGEYGTPNCDIPEGRIPEKCIGTGEYTGKCPMSGLLFPRTAGSFYHLSKVMDTLNIEFACRIWGLRSTDIMQGVVFGLNEVDKDELLTRFDYDECFGTVINRFCVQALINHPLTIYGAGGQTRGYLPLKDSLQCLTLAIDNPPAKGEYRTLNQFESTYSVNALANEVIMAAMDLGLKVDNNPISNPRVEAEEHYYNPVHQKLFDLGYVPTTDIRGEIAKLLKRLTPFKSSIRREVILPTITWR